ncbi:MAG: hypothetical protein ABFD10_13195 [Prolixibacteraceae bacterium]
MTTNVTQAFLEAFRTQELLSNSEIKNIISVIEEIIAAYPDPITFFSHKSQDSLDVLKAALQRALSTERDFQVLMVLFGSLLTDEWLANLARIIGDTVAEREKAVTWWFSSIMNDNLTQAMGRSLLLFSRHIKEHRPEEFRREFIVFLSRSGDLRRFALAASVLDDDDKVLLEPLKGFLLKFHDVDASIRETRAARKELNEVATAIKAVIRKIEGKPEQKKWWKLWKL